MVECNNIADGVRVSIGVMEEHKCEVMPTAAQVAVSVSSIDKTGANLGEAVLVIASSDWPSVHVLPGHWIRVDSADNPTENSGLFWVVEIEAGDATRLHVFDPNSQMIDETAVGATTAKVVYEGIRATLRNVNYERDEIVSQEVRADRQVVDVRGGFEQVTGQLGFELSCVSYDTLLAGALANDYSKPIITTTGALTLTAGPPDSDVAVLTRTTGDFVQDGVRPGTVLNTTGSAEPANNGLRIVLEIISPTILEVSDPGNLVVNGQDPTAVELPGKVLDAGTVKRTYHVIRSFNDIGMYQVFRGVAVNSMSLNLTPGDPVGGTFDFLGMSALPLTNVHGSEETPSPTSGFLSSFDGVLYEGGTYNDVITSIDFTLENNRQLSPVVGKTTSPGVFEGQCIVTGSLSAMFKGGALFNKFYNEERSNATLLMYDANDSNGFIALTLHNLKYTGATMDPPNEGAVIQEMPFRALGTNVNVGGGNEVTTNVTFQVYNFYSDQRGYPQL